MADFNINKKDLKVSGTDEVIIDNPKLAELVKSNKNEAAKLLSEHTVISPNDLTVDEHGKVGVKNAAFKAKAADFIQGGTGFNFIVC